MSKVTVYEQDQTLMLTASTAQEPFRVMAAKAGETRVVVGREMVALRPGEDAIVERGHIIAPRRILDERRADLGRRLGCL